MVRRVVSIILLTAGVLLVACHSAGHSGSTDAATLTRDQGYGLLYSTISDECGVDKVLVIKNPAPQVAELIKAIGQFARDTRRTLRSLAKEEPAIDLDNQGLPETETNTRAAISSATSGQILFSRGKELEFRLLLTQHEALNYITHLAGTLADQDPRENRKRFLEQLSKQSDALHERVLAQLKAPYVDQPK